MRFAMASAGGGSPASSARAFCSEIPLDGEGRAPEWIRLFPGGPGLRAVDGRRWQLSDPQAVASLTNERRGGVDLCVDWEHAQERKARQGERADAAAWIKQVAVRDGALMARVEWTEAGRQSVESGGYRYFSPSFAHRRTIRLPGQPDGGEVAAVAGGALVNRPAFDMPALAGEQEEESMLKKILEALGLASDATEEQAVAAVAALKSERDEAKSQAAADPPADKFVPRSMYDQALERATAAEGKLAGQAKEALAAEIKAELDAAQEAGKITPAQRPWFESQCAREGGLEEVRELLGTTATASAAPGPGGGSAAPPKPEAAGFASAEEAAIASLCGRDAKFLDEHSPRSQGVS